MVDLKNEIFQYLILQEAEVVKVEIEQLQSKWPEGVKLDLGIKKIYYECLPYLFYDLFTSLSLTNIRQLNLAIKLLVSSAYIYDKLMDGQHQYCSIESGLRVQAMQFESYQQLNYLFNPESMFWDKFRKYVAEYAQLSLQEEAFKSGKQPWCEYTEKVSLQMAVGTGILTKLTVAGLVELSGDDRYTDALNESIDYFSIAIQMLDDLDDWKEDLYTGVPSLLTSRLVDRQSQSTTDLSQIQIDRLSRKLYYEGHADYVLRIAIESLDKAIKSIEYIPEIGLHLEIRRLLQKCHLLADDFKKIISTNLQRAREKKIIGDISNQ